MTGPVHENLVRLGLELPAALPPQGSYVASRRAGALLFVAGHTGRSGETAALAGVVGDDVSLEEAQESARLTAVNLLGAVEEAVGVEHVSLVFLRGYVRAAADIRDYTRVVDAASELLTDVLAEAGTHARASVGVNILPGGAVVELEAVFEVLGAP